MPDDIDGLPSTHFRDFLPVDEGEVLYEAEIDHGKPFRFYRFLPLCLLTPLGLTYLIPKGAAAITAVCTCDEACCWLRKEYSTRSFYRVHANRIVFNSPTARLFGCCGCGSWNADNVKTHPFDRGAFGFSSVPCGTIQHLCCCWPLYGGTVARHRCQCNGPLYNRMCTDCGGWWCDEWLCKIWLCTYRYYNLADPDEVAFASSIALQAYFEGRKITARDMELCLDFWKTNISQQADPIARKRHVCCEPYFVPWVSCACCYAMTHPRRSIPFGEEETTDELREVRRVYML